MSSKRVAGGPIVLMTVPLIALMVGCASDPVGGPRDAATADARARRADAVSGADAAETPDAAVIPDARLGDAMAAEDAAAVMDAQVLEDAAATDAEVADAAPMDASAPSDAGLAEDAGQMCIQETESCAQDMAGCCPGLKCCVGTPVPPGQEFCAMMCPRSDRNLKRGFRPVDGDTVLDRVARLPISTWVYKDDARHARHLGPMAQDFKAAFALGDSDRYIHPIDADGVAFASIQALHRRVIALEAENARLQRWFTGLGIAFAVFVVGGLVSRRRR